MVVELCQALECRTIQTRTPIPFVARSFLYFHLFILCTLSPFHSLRFGDPLCRSIDFSVATFSIHSTNLLGSCGMFVLRTVYSSSSWHIVASYMSYMSWAYLQPSYIRITISSYRYISCVYISAMRICYLFEFLFAVPPSLPFVFLGWRDASYGLH